MKKFMQILPVVVVIAGVSVIIHEVVKEKRAKRETAAIVTKAETVAPEDLPVDESLPEQDIRVMTTTFESPETLDESPVEPSEVALEVEDATLPLEEEMVVEAPEELEDEAIEMADVPSQVVSEPLQENKNGFTKPYYEEDFVSLRTTELLDPDSETNQKTIEKLMDMRKERLDRL